MTTTVIELYTALRQAGVDEDTARRAARAVLAVSEKEHLASKADLTEVRLAMRADLAEVKADIIKWNLAAMGILTVVYAGINTLLRFKP